MEADVNILGEYVNKDRIKVKVQTEVDAKVYETWITLTQEEYETDGLDKRIGTWIGKIKRDHREMKKAGIEKKEIKLKGLTGRTIKVQEREVPDRPEMSRKNRK